MGIAPRTLGFVGTGHVTEHFLRFLNGDNEGNTLEAKAGSLLREYFFQAAESIHFYIAPGRGTTKNTFEQQKREEYPQLVERLRGRLDLSGRPKIVAYEDFREFYTNTGVTIDTSADFRFRLYNQIPPYLQPVLDQCLHDGPAYNAKKLCDEYFETREKEGKPILDLEQFRTLCLRRLNLAAQTLKIIRSLQREGHQIGPRTQNLFPFNVGLYSDRARELLRVSQLRDAQDLGVTVVVSNEPNLLASILCRVNPRLSERTIACSGVDKERVLMMEIEELKHDKNFPTLVRGLGCSLGGIHDDGQAVLFFPSYIPTPPGYDEELLQSYFQRNLDRYYQDHKDKEGTDFMRELDRSLAKIVINAWESLGRGLTTFPDNRFVKFFPYDRFLCDGYYHQQEEIFLAGDYQLRNGFVEPLATPEIKSKKVRDELWRVTNTCKELVRRLFAGPLERLAAEAESVMEVES